MSKKYSIWVFVAVVILLPVTVFAIVNWYQNKFDGLPVLNEKEQTVPEFRLTNQNGNIITQENWKNKIVVVDFFFTHCPSVCPRMSTNLKEVQKAFRNDNKISINSFSVDPEDDSVGRLQEYIRQFQIDDTDWNFLTGDKKEIYRLARKSFLVVATDGDGGPHDFIHSDKLILLDTHQKIRGYYQGTSEQEVKQLINDIKKLKNEN